MTWYKEALQKAKVTGKVSEVSALKSSIYVGKPAPPPAAPPPPVLKRRG